MSNLIISWIRTVTAAAVAALVTWLIRQGWSVDPSVEQPLTEALVVVLTGGYYWLVRLAEAKVSPLFGYLLGVPKAPSYEQPPETPPPGQTPASR